GRVDDRIHPVLVGCRRRRRPSLPVVRLIAQDELDYVAHARRAARRHESQRHNSANTDGRSTHIKLLGGPPDQPERRQPPPKGSDIPDKQLCPGLALGRKTATGEPSKARRWK